MMLRFGRGSSVLVVALAGACICGVVPPAAAAEGKPVISGFMAAPAGVAVGAMTTISASVTGATECTLSAKGPKTASPIAGLPVTFSCASGSVSRELVMPSAPVKKLTTYKLTLKATAAGGKSAKARATVTDGAFTVPPEPLTGASYQLNECKEGDERKEAALTSRLFLSGDGTSAVWGACTYSFNGTNWVAGTTLPGFSLGMSRDGLTLVTSGSASEGIASYARASEEEEWAPQATCITSCPPENTTPNVSLSADGNTLLIDPVEHTVNGYEGMRVYERFGESWVEGEAPQFGAQDCTAGVLSANGETAVLRCYPAGELTELLVFVRSGTGWLQQGPPLRGVGEEKGDDFAEGVQGGYALSASGDTILVGASGADKSKGEVWTFRRNGESWSEYGSPLIGGVKGGLFGRGVALNAEGNMALIAAPIAPTTVREGGETFQEKPYPGRVYVEEILGNGQWGNVQILQSADQKAFGPNVALSESGSTALVAGPETGLGLTRDASDVYVFNAEG